MEVTMVAETYSLELPEIFSEEDEETIHERVLDSVPGKFDKTEGSFIWDMTRPPSMEIAQVIEFHFPLLISVMFPQFAEDIFLDYHGGHVGVIRRKATKSTGKIKVKGSKDTFIPEGTTVMTDEVDEASIEFVTREDATINDSNEAVIPIEAVESGSIGNVAADTIRNFLTPISGVTDIRNESETKNGYDEESDEDYRERVMTGNRTQSFTGNRTDYESWAKEIEGVGQVIVIPEADGPGTVNVLISASDGSIATKELIENVQEHIAPDGRDGGGLAPIGAKVKITGIEGYTVNVNIIGLDISRDYDTDDVIESIKSSIDRYLSDVNHASSESDQQAKIIHAKIFSKIVAVSGVNDIDNVEINGTTSNITLDNGEIAVMGEVTSS